MRTVWISLVMVVALVAIACAPAGLPGEDTGGISGDGDRDAGAADGSADGGSAVGAPDPQLISDLRADDAAAVGQAVNAFGFDLLELVAEEGANTVTSPLSVATMLAMVLAGAGGDTAEEMAQGLQLDDARDVRVGALLQQLVDTADVTVEVANALWAHQGVAFEPDYLDFTRSTFGATVEEADLGAQETAEAIDVWVREQTRDLIDGIAEDLGLPDPQSVLVLLNAVYFLGRWTTQFDPAQTRDEPFTLADGTAVDVPMMTMADQQFGYVDGEGFTMVRLPYGDSGRFGMEVLLPDGDLPALVEEMDAAAWAAAATELSETTIDHLALPRFELEWQATLNEPLQALGMGAAFSAEADFRPMSAADPFLDTVVHKTYIRVDEEGTEAAAVTGGTMAVTAVADPLVFRADRPFMFTISDAETGTILFLGTVSDPRG